MATDPRIDDYIERAAPFAQPILRHLRALVHAALPGADETIKWGMPHFMKGGKNVAGMAAFKAHCAFTIHGEGRGGTEGMGQHGRLTAMEDLPPDAELTRKIKAAAERIAAHGSAAKRPANAQRKPEIAIPPDFADALTNDPGARATFDSFAPGARRDYLEWITEAKRDETRARRICQAIEWLAEGKKRNWKYERC